MNKKITCDKLVIACGSRAYPKTGSDGIGYKFLSNFNKLLKSCQVNFTNRL